MLHASAITVRRDVRKVDQTRCRLYFDIQMLALQILTEAMYVLLLVCIQVFTLII